MLLQANTLIGLSKREVLGESILGIMSKTAADNYLCWREIKLIFLDKPNKGPLFNRTLASQCDGIDFTAISSLYVSENDYKKSFGYFYFPSWIPFERLEKSQLCHQNITICPECAKLGKHLFLHQIKLFGFCPIHKVKLHDTCSSCSKQIGYFQIDSGNRKKEIYNAFKCKFCGHENLTFNNISSKNLKLFQNNLKSFLKDYEVWLTDLNKIYSQYAWMNIYGNLNIALTLSKPPEQVWKSLQDTVFFIKGEVEYELCSGASKLPDSASILQKKLSFNNLCEELLLFSQDQLTKIESRFNISRNQYRTAYFLTRYTNIFYGENYTIWAHAYVELCHAMYYRYQRGHEFSDVFSSHYWLIGMWYTHFAAPLLKYFEIHDANHVKILVRLSKIWIRKFIVQLFSNEVYRLSKGLIGIEQDIWCRLIDRVGEDHPLFSLVVAYKMESETNKVWIFREGPAIKDLIFLQKSGFNGFTPIKQQCFTNYRKLHSVFKISGKPFNKYDYFEMLSKKPIVKIS
ncbi:hypothetical protein Q7A_1946 [Methylophaga nitratireducenticrescens]|uniref:TniQ protein n=1 Tax=Methylophaga nitratireducenticrescens TaxID=754476 RepID=I1XK44_METNJ|nr:hypothetical protein [Methylophaga nitratireducenticrescens]AFI84763.1 hypothetical protein Q7A_1946 [Methylophaga nitratireducenticrescens]